MAKFSEWIRLFGVSREWRPYWADDDVPLEDGSAASGLVMRRRDGNRVVYRRATDEEAEDAKWFFAIR